jgi:hypothetical protein
MLFINIDILCSSSTFTDLILNEFIKTGNSTLILTLVKLFNKILKSGKFPKPSNTDTPIVIRVIWITRFINGGKK